MSEFRPSAVRAPRALRLACLGLAAGAVAGMAAAGDIEASYRKGRVAAVSLSLPAPARAPSLAGSTEDHALANAHGFALAAQHRFTQPADCRAVRAEFRIGCEDYVDKGRVAASDARGDLAFGG
jgi:hypothetical protein